MFAGLSPQRLAELAEAASIRTYAKDEQLFARGDRGDFLYVVVRGSIAVTASNSAGRDVTLQIFTATQSFGELAVLDGGPRVATATARERATVVAVRGDRVRALYSQEPAIAAALLRAVTRMTRQVHGHSLDLVTIDLPGRVAKHLLTTVRPTTEQVKARQPIVVNLPLNQTELATLVGGSRQHVNKVIVDLETSGAITRSGRRIVSVRPDLLAAAARAGAR